MKKIYLLLSLVSIQFVFPQSPKFGKVDKAELLEKHYDRDSSANAVILYKNQETYFVSSSIGVELVTEIHKRIKIYNKDGFDKATVSLNLYKNRNTKERVSRIKAYTFNLVGGKVEKTALDKDQIFKTEYSYNYNQVKFTLPNVKEGSVMDIRYKISSPFYFNIDEFRFQYDIPIKRLEAEIRTPKGYNFNAKQKGYLSFAPKHTLKQDNAIGMSVDVLNYTLDHVPALKEESFVDNMDNYRAGVIFELVSIERHGSSGKYFAKTWGDVAKTIGSTEDYKEELDKTRSFDDTLDAIIADKENDIEKMNAIFKHVKQNIKWNGLDGKYFQKGIRNAIKEKKGNAADVNLTLVAMLRYAGIDANPLIISTKDNLIPFFPTVDRLNYVIAYAYINNKRYFLDATDEFSDVNLLPLKDYNWQGILVDNNKLVWKKVGISTPKTGESQYMVTAKLDEEGVIEGNIKSRHTNHSAYEFRQNFKNRDLDAFITEKEEVLDNIEISNYEAKNTDGYKGYVSESYDFYKESSADIIDGKIYIQPLLFLKIDKNPFRSETRAFPIDFGYPMKNRYMVNIAFPEDYVLESNPEPVVVKIPNGLGEFNFVSKVIGNKIQLSSSLELNEATMSADTYLFLKEFFNQMINKQKEQIVLTKAQP